jgi:hypothetical protein
LIQNAFAKVSIAHDVDDLQVLECDQVIGLRIDVRHFVEQVLPLVLDMFVQTLDAQDCLATVFAVFLFALHAPLRNGKLALGYAIVFVRFDTLALAISEQVFDIQIDADLLSTGINAGLYGASSNIRLRKMTSVIFLVTSIALLVTAPTTGQSELAG